MLVGDGEEQGAKAIDATGTEERAGGATASRIGTE